MSKHRSLCIYCCCSFRCW